MDENPQHPRPTQLTTERQYSPIGLDRTVPLLAWKLAATGRERNQAGYRIRMVIDADPTDSAIAAVWDTGVVRSPASVDIPYAGEPLRSRTRYVWSVRVLDENGRDSGWGEPAEFETAFLDPADWDEGTASAWICAPDEPDRETTVNLDLAGHHRSVERIRPPAGSRYGQVWFRTSFELPQERTPRSIRLAADAGESSAEVQCFVGGRQVPADGTAGDPAVIQAGTNILEIRVTPGASTELGREEVGTGQEGSGQNGSGQKGGGQESAEPEGRRPDGIALAARLEIDVDNGRPLVVVSDGSWQLAAGPVSGPESALSGSECGTEPLAESVGLHGATDHGRSPLTYRPSPCLRRAFEVTGPVRRARLYATALGTYAAAINGRGVGTDRLAPGWTDYSTRVPYQTYDVTDLLVDGANAIGVRLADGWYAGNIGWFGPFRYGDRRAFRARLEVEYPSGDRFVVGTDGTWLAGDGEIRHADLQNGEVVDARHAVPGWDRPEFDAQGWSPVAVLEPRHGLPQAATAPPIRVQHELTPTRIERRPNGNHLIDFGQNLVGWISLRARGEAGRRLLIRHAEALDHKGELYLEALRSARATDEYILRGDPDGEVFEPTFTVHGFRYCEIVGWPAAQKLRPEDVTARAAYAAMDQIGEFACSDPRLNKLQDNIVWGQRGNFLSVPTDCPQRDERLGWTGDAQVFAATAAFNYDVRTFLEKWLRDLRDAQFEDGAVPHVAPDLISAPGRPAAGAAGWGDAIAVVPYELLLAYGDHRIVEECYPAVVAWLDYLQAHSDAHIRPAEGFADWLAITATPKDLVSTAFFAYAAQLAGRLANVLGSAADERRWQDLYTRVRAAFRARFVRGGGRVVSGTQTAYVLALRFGLLNADEEPKAAAALVEEIAGRQWHLTTGFLGTPFLLDVLSRFGHEEAAYRLLLQETFPSWLYPVVHGDATTVWERWDSWSHSRGFQDPGMTSFNHYAYGAVGAWMYSTIGGIAPAEPGYRSTLIRPRPGGGLTWASAALETPYGRVETDWRVEGGEFRLDVSIPPNTTAEVRLPGSQTAEPVGSGSHTFQTPMPDPA